MRIVLESFLTIMEEATHLELECFTSLNMALDLSLAVAWAFYASVISGFLVRFSASST